MKRVYLQIKLRDDPRIVAVPYLKGKDTEECWEIAKREALEIAVATVEKPREIRMMIGLDEFDNPAIEHFRHDEVTRVSVRLLDVKPQGNVPEIDPGLQDFLRDINL